MAKRVRNTNNLLKERVDSRTTKYYVPGTDVYYEITQGSRPSSKNKSGKKKTFYVFYRTDGKMKGMGAQRDTREAAEQKLLIHYKKGNNNG